MKFTPETLLQIYLDGSFTEEAQAEFDALMRKDPAFAERVTQALAERLGPVPDSTVDALSSRLDGKMGDLWNRHKPSTLGRLLKLGFATAMALTAAGGLFLGGRFLAARMNSTAPSGVLPVAKPSLSAVDTDGSKGQETAPKTVGKKPVAGTSGSGNPTLSVRKTQVPLQTIEYSGENKNATPALSTPANAPQSGVVLPSPSTSNQKSLSPGRSTSPVGKPGASLDASSPAVTAEGNSLRVAIDTDKTQNVTVTVFDANGLLIRHLYSGVVPAGEHAVDWDGKDELGNVVLPGDYTVILDMGGKKMSGILKVLPSR